jgi:hypothetical protein
MIVEIATRLLLKTFAPPFAPQSIPVRLRANHASCGDDGGGDGVWGYHAVLA